MYASLGVMTRGTIVEVCQAYFANHGITIVVDSLGIWLSSII